jgi:hypothetical protein
MTTPKRDMQAHGERAPSYVSREIGAAELCISPSTWDRWVAERKLPAPSPEFPADSPRWRWADVDHRLSGKGKEIAPETPKPSVDPYIAGLANIHGKKKGRERAAA